MLALVYERLQESASWDSNGRLWRQIHNARDVPPMSAQRDAPLPIPVRARLVWEREGEELVNTLALGWTPTLVRVEIRDDRWRIHAAWLAAQDVARRSES